MGKSVSGTGQKSDNLIEGAALSASLLCLVHCLALPLLLLLLPGVLGLFARSEAFHYVALAFLLPSALAAFWFGYRRHGAKVPAILGTVGIAFISAALLPGVAEEGETRLTAIGSLLLVGGHVMNWRLRTHV